MKFLKSITALAALFTVSTSALPYRGQDSKDFTNYVTITSSPSMSLDDIKNKFSKDLPGFIKTTLAFHALSILHKNGQNDDACSSTNIYNAYLKDMDTNVSLYSSIYKNVFRHFENEHKYLCSKTTDNQFCEPKAMIQFFDHYFEKDVGRICARGAINDCEKTEIEFFKGLASNGSSYDLSNNFKTDNYTLNYKITVFNDGTIKHLLNECEGKERPPVDPNGKCGKGLGGCQNGYCCSKYGWCGKTESHCDINQGCQNEFGYCKSSSSTYPTTPTSTTPSVPSSIKTDLPIDPNGKCGKGFGGCPSGNCCSKYGWCGKTKYHCDISQGCQSEFGQCN